jgi:hypothetical protein
MKNFSTLRPWLGLGLAIWEAVQPLFGRPVEATLVALAGTMMAAEAAAQALKKISSNEDDER